MPVIQRVWDETVGCAGEPTDHHHHQVYVEQSGSASRTYQIAATLSVQVCALLYGVCTSQSAFKTHVLAHLLKIRSTVMLRTSVVTMTVVEEVQKVLTLAQGGPIMTRL